MMTTLQAWVIAHPVTSYLLFISVVTFLLFGYDKMKARAGWWRTPEKTLLGFCLFGGSLGGGVGMMVFRHKVSKRSFLISYFLIVGIQVVVSGVLMYQRSQVTGNSGVHIAVEPVDKGRYKPPVYGSNR